MRFLVVALLACVLACVSCVSAQGGGGCAATPRSMCSYPTYINIVRSGLPNLPTINRIGNSFNVKADTDNTPPTVGGFHLSPVLYNTVTFLPSPQCFSGGGPGSGGRCTVTLTMQVWDNTGGAGLTGNGQGLRNGQVSATFNNPWGGTTTFGCQAGNTVYPGGKDNRTWTCAHTFRDQDNNGTYTLAFLNATDSAGNQQSYDSGSISNNGFSPTSFTLVTGAKKPTPPVVPTAHPSILNITVFPVSLTVGNNGQHQTFTVLVEAVCDFHTTLANVDITFTAPSGSLSPPTVNVNLPLFFGQFGGQISGNQSFGWWQWTSNTLFVQPGDATGVWTVTSATVTDAVGNSQSYTDFSRWVPNGVKVKQLVDTPVQPPQPGNVQDAAFWPTVIDVTVATGQGQQGTVSANCSMTLVQQGANPPRNGYQCVLFFQCQNNVWLTNTGNFRTNVVNNLAVSVGDMSIVDYRTPNGQCTLSGIVGYFFNGTAAGPSVHLYGTADPGTMAFLDSIDHNSASALTANALVVLLSVVAAWRMALHN